MKPVPHKEIYQKFASKYDLLRSRMDYQGNLFKKMNEIASFKGKDVVELAAGSGLHTCMIAPLAKTVKAFDISSHMLDFARKKLEALPAPNWSLGLADNRSIPLPDNCADIVLEGWSLGYMVALNSERWESEIEKVICEMDRLCRAGGTIIILGTLGTGSHVPKAPNQGLANLYRYLENELKFSKEVVHTDYRFESVEEAAELTGFFWSERFGDYVKINQLREIPECTGVWYFRK